MILVLCSRADRVALDFAKRHASVGVRALTCADISRQGWTLELHRGAVCITAALGDGECSTGRRHVVQVDGVITRLGYVSEAEVGYVVPDDRPYVAAELHAFLFAVLKGMACPKVNAPSLACLYTPHPRASNWRRLARSVGLVVADECVAQQDVTSRFTDVTVVGERVWGEAPVRLREMTLQLAAAAGVVHLRARYRIAPQDARFCGVDPYPQLESEQVGEALIRFCRNGCAH